MTSLFSGIVGRYTKQAFGHKSLIYRAILAGTCLSTTLLLSEMNAIAQTAINAAEEAPDEAGTKKKKTTEAGIETTADGAVKLNQIVVTATGFEQNITDARQASLSFPAKSWKAHRDLTDALKDVQGVAVDRSSGRARHIHSWSSWFLYCCSLIGKRQSTRDARTNGNSGFEQSFLPPANAIERIEVIRGPMSSLYGSDAMGGVINVITKKVSDTWSGSFSVDGTVQQHSKFGNSLQGSYYMTGPLVPELVGVQVWGRGLKRQEDNIVSGTPEQKDIDITGRVCHHAE